MIIMYLQIILKKTKKLKKKGGFHDKCGHQNGFHG
jgi:hypothetical protein